MNYLDAFAPIVIRALHPTAWPRVVVLDSVPLLTRGYRRSADEDDDERVGNLKAGTILVGLDGTARGARPWLMRVAGARDAESWKDFRATLTGAPEIGVADLDTAIARAVRETWPDAIIQPSRHHLAALMRDRAIADGVPERIRAETPEPLARPAALDRRAGEALGHAPTPRGHARGPAWPVRVGRLRCARRASRVT